MNLVRRINHRGKLVSFCLLALVLVFGAMFISCTDPGKIIPNTDNAEQPIITAQPAGGFWNVFPEANNTFDLTVTANVTDDGNLTYQWYSNTSKSATGGTAITTNGTSKTLSLSKNNYTANGYRYFYVVVTNTNNETEGVKTASVTSAVAEVAVVGNPDTAYTTSAMPENLKGTWTYDWGGGFIEKYIVNETTFISEYTYTGTIVGHRSNNDGDGYITIKFTENSGFVNSENMFYVIHYKDLSISEVTLAGASFSADPDFEYGVGPGGKTTQAEAEAVMTVSAGYFDWYSILDKEGYTNADHPHISAQPAGGSWNASANNTFTLTVSANIDDNGTLSYQWYSNTSASNHNGTIMSGKTAATLQLEKANYTANGTYYFYVEVTNTNNSVNGNKTAHSTSNVATVTISVNSVAPSFEELFAPFVGTWSDPYGDTFVFDTPDYMGYDIMGFMMGLFIGWEGKVLDIAYFNETEGMIYIKIETSEGWGLVNSGDFTGIYFKNKDPNNKLILNLAVEGENIMGYQYGQPMYQTLAEAKAALDYEFVLTTLIITNVNYTKQ